MLPPHSPGSGSASQPSRDFDTSSENPVNAPAPVILSFDVEEHDRIEAAAGLEIPCSLKEVYGNRMVASTQWILGQLDRLNIRATFFIVGQVARSHPDLVKAIHASGHEVASHGWDHRRIHRMNPESFREDLRLTRHLVHPVTRQAVLGYRAPTFSLVRETAWALEILATSGLLYDSSIFPVRHDRYGIPQAPRTPFLACGPGHEILEFPPATLALGSLNLPIAGGGYFRLLPGSWMRWAVDRARWGDPAGATMLYFHPWEFDPDQPRLPLKRLSRFRTYVGITWSRTRLLALLSDRQFARAIDMARIVLNRREKLPCFRVSLSDSHEIVVESAPRSQ